MFLCVSKCILIVLYSCKTFLFSPLPEVTLMDANYTIDEKLGQPQKIALTSLPYSKEEMTLQFNEVHSPLQMNSCFMYKFNCQ